MRARRSRSAVRRRIPRPRAWRSLRCPFSERRHRGRRVARVDRLHHAVDRRVDDVEHGLGVEAERDDDDEEGRDREHLTAAKVVHLLGDDVGRRPGHRALVHQQDVERREHDADRGDGTGPDIALEGADEDEELADEARQTRQRERGEPGEQEGAGEHRGPPSARRRSRR